MLFTTIDYERTGKQQGYLQLPYSYDLGAWANLMIPMTMVKNGKGPTALVLGGTHGDEYPGQIAAIKLAREVDPAKVSGRIIFIPMLNLPAAKASTRLSPLDGKNLNRAFPGEPEGTPTEQIADYLTRVLFPTSDIVIDIHSGGRTLVFLPCACMDLVPEKNQRKKMLEANLAWNADFLLLYLTNVAGTGLLPVEAERQGKVVVTTEMGGGETIPAEVHRLTQCGLRNVLAHFGMLEGKVETREGLGKSPTIVVQSLSKDDYVLAPESGIFEITVDLGTFVRRGQQVGLLHFLERPDRNPEEITAKTEGYLMCFRAPCLTSQGDCVAVIGQRVEASSLF
jgi:predicted deacylase